MADVDTSAWDASKAWAAGSNSDDPAAFFKGICAGEKSDGDPDTQAHWALPHHYAPGDPPNKNGVRAALGRIGQTDGLKNKNAAQSHLDSHQSAIEKAEKAASGRKDVRAARAEYAKRGELPGGQLRTRRFPGKIQCRLVDRGGKQFYHVEGFATVFERGYEMWDMFGSYNETMAGSSLDKSLSAGPDVAFLVNHRGVTMARTTNGTLELSKKTNEEGYRGLHADAYLNPDRQDVRDFVSAVVDGLVDEMSFAFMLNDGQWNDDYTEFRITEADINRGDVSGVNYGANPFTSIQARTADILEDLERLPEVAVPEALSRMAARLTPELGEAVTRLSERASNGYVRGARMFPGAVEEDNTEKEAREDPKLDKSDLVHIPGGKSLSLWRTRLEALKSE